MPLTDLTHRTFGTLKVIDTYSKKDHRCKSRGWSLCICACCKKEIEVLNQSLINGSTTTCGKSRELKDLTNQKFGMLTALHIAYRTENKKHTFWHCVCECTNTIEARTDWLTTGVSTHCGCQTPIKQSKPRTHGMSNTKTYRIWKGMIQRCENPNNERYDCYGGRGIQVCKRWHKFENFLEDMGECPYPNYSIERVNVNGNYEPDNCTWIPLADQWKNKRPFKARNQYSK